MTKNPKLLCLGTHIVANERRKVKTFKDPSVKK
jgi:hypothetical protein